MPRGDSMTAALPTPAGPAGGGAARATGEPADVRTGARWSAPQRLKNGALYALVRVALALARRVPPGALRALGARLGVAAFWLLRGPRALARANVKRAFPALPAAEREALVRRTYRTLGALLGETVAALRGAGPGPLEFDAGSRECLSDALAQGRGVLFASAHLGPWERVAATLVAAGFPLVALARESYDPRLTRLYDELRGRAGVRFVYRGSPGAAGRIVRTLRGGGLLGVPMDLASRVPSIASPFLGHDAPTAVGPARIALRTGAAVVVGTPAPRRGAEGRADVDLVLRVTAIPTGDLEANDAGERTLTARINAELSDRIRALPSAWVWMHARWTPGREPAPRAPRPRA